MPASRSRTASPTVATANQSMLANLPVQSAVDRTSAGSKTGAHSKLHPASWSLAVVEKFFAERGFAEQAAIFKDQVGLDRSHIPYMYSENNYLIKKNK